MESALIHFHGFVGTQLDIIAMHLCSKPSGSEEILLPASYYEYCTYRLIHRWRLLGSEESEHMIKWRPTKTMSGREAESMVGASTMAVIHLVLVVMQCLNNDSDSTYKIDFACERIISNFELTVIQNSPTASQNRCRSVLTDPAWFAERDVQNNVIYSVRNTILQESVMLRSPAWDKLSQST